METLNEYEQQANEFLNKTGATITINYKKFDFHFDGDKHRRDIYSICIKRGNRSMSFDFGQSLKDSGVQVINKNTNEIKRVFDADFVTDRNGKIDRYSIERILKYRLISSEFIKAPKKPTNYSILSCLTKLEPGTFEDFCDNFGYNIDSIKASKTYEAIKKEFKDLQALFNDNELNELAEIQ